MKQFIKEFYYPSAWLMLAGGIVIGILISLVTTSLFSGQDNAQPSEIAIEDSLEIVQVEQNMEQNTDNEMQTYTVKSGDTLWQIALDQYGDGEKYLELAIENEIANPDQLAVGTELRVRPQESENSNGPSLSTYQVKTGDSLWSIAERFLGNGEGWQQLYQLNETIIGDNPHHIYSGQRLQLPERSVKGHSRQEEGGET